MAKKKKITFVGILLDEESKWKLTNKLVLPSCDTVYLDRVTLEHGLPEGSMLEEWVNSHLGKEVEVWTKAKGYDINSDGCVYVIEVDTGAPCMLPHIVIGTTGQRRPPEDVSTIDWKWKTIESITLTGKVIIEMGY